jgi:hypothetical protein
LDSRAGTAFVKSCKGHAHKPINDFLRHLSNTGGRIFRGEKTMRLRFGVGFYSALLGVMLAGTSCSSSVSKGAGPETGLQPTPDKQAQTQTAPAPVQQVNVPPQVVVEPAKPAAKPKPPVNVAAKRPAPVVAPAPVATPAPAATPAPRPTTNTSVAVIPPDQVSIAPEPERPKAPEPPKERHMTIPAGTMIPVRMIEPISTESDHVGQTFKASIDGPVVVNGETVIPRRADAFVKVVEAKGSGQLTGKPELKVQLDSILVDGKRYTIDSNVFLREGESQTKQTAKKAGLGALIGAGIGAIAGGGKGAAIGATVGAGGGVAVEAASKNEQATIESETRIDFRLEGPLEVTLKGEPQINR